MKARLLVFVTISMLLIAVDSNTAKLSVIRNSLFVLVKPVVEVAEIPAFLKNQVELLFEQRDSLRERNRILIRKNKELQVRINELQAHEQRNIWLAELLGAREKIDYAVLPAKATAIQLQPLSRKILLDRGTEDNVVIGQPVLDQRGIIGQVTGTTRTQSAVTLITDPNHSIPVRIQRNGILAIANGLGETNQLQVTGLPFDADIQEGDILVTSGLGERFPTAYPVAKVTSVDGNRNTAFAEVSAVPLTTVDPDFEVLLVWSQGHPAINEASEISMNDSN